MTDDRPNPDALLAAAKSTEARKTTGRLKVFLGMCPGVGKTFAMLETTQARHRAGEDVLVGLVETHGRRETEALLAGLEVLPRREVVYRGARLSEFDLDLALARRPTWLVVDELAHANVPGSRHERRWQDVRELLAAGINVLSTLNLQHVESRAGTVREITGIDVRETVPDSVLDQAELELVDLSPLDLRRRLAEGKVYLGDRAALAAGNYFREANLTALREMALRLVAEHAGHDTREFHRASLAPEPWKSGHRLLVAVGPSPHAQQLIRWTRRFSDSLDCPWMAVHVEGADPMSSEVQARLTANLDLARELRAEVVVTPDVDFVGGLLRVAREANATHLILGKPVGSFLARWRGRWNLLRLVRASGGIDVHIVRVEEGPERKSGTTDPEPLPTAVLATPWREHAVAVVAVALTAGLCALLDPLLGPRALAFIFLIPVVALALVLGRAAVFAVATLSALAWNFFFLPPRLTLRIGSLDDVVLFGSYFVVAAFVGQLVHRLRRQEQMEHQREARTRVLYELTRALAETRSRDEVVWRLLDALGRAFSCPAAVSFGQPTGEYSPHPDSTLPLDDKERGVALWAARSGKPSGRFTENLPAAAALHLPMVTDRGVAGVLSVGWPGSHPPSIPQRELLDAFARHAALVLDRQSLQAEAERGRLAAESERLGRALLDSVSHELRTPLTALQTAGTALSGLDFVGQPKTAQLLVDEVSVATGRLTRLVGHLLDMSRVESGALRPTPQWTDAYDLANAVQRRLAMELREHPWTAQIDPARALVWLDPRLTEQALVNLVHNACVHTPAGTPIELVIRPDADTLSLEVRDRGPGFATDALPFVFDKFYRAPEARAGGTGLGLAIVKGFILAQGGSILASNREGGGSWVGIRLPQPPLPPAPKASA